MAAVLVRPYTWHQPRYTQEASMDQGLAQGSVRVLHVLNELRASGAELMLHSAATEWKKHGVEAHLLAVAPTVGTFADRLRVAGYRVAHELDDPLWRLPARFRRRVAAGRYDVVHLHAERGSFWLGLAALSTGATVVRTVHNAFGFRGLLRVQRAVQRGVLRSAGVVHVCVGPSVADNERGTFGNPAEVVENWYDEMFVPPTLQQRAVARTELGLDDRDLVAVSVGNCSPVKRHEAVLEAMVHPDCPPHLKYVHVGEEVAARDERRLSERLGVADRVRFLGQTHPLAALHAADVFVMPSVYEGLSIAAVEALATGLPAVLTDAPGLRDLAEDNSAVTLIDITPGGFAKAIGQAARLSAGRHRDGVPRDVDAVRNRFGMGRGVAQYVDIYRRTWGPPRRS
ncbi:glycosyltransferase [Actinacidiphila oryziradicis]|uniref:D-inositol 3-phosphate glycosyltransferase n=1 Tax=Actinacidiphila oryziradicis TaxID=2571141 RepID=A0A4V5N0E2_9ACTN|nr:glycosyltransferase [Actinacidiphila oryziradicis]TKA11619.1 glycosyltransferase [Actinacidiphila oryziradicis]